MLNKKILLLALALSLTACGKEEAPKESVEERNIQALLTQIEELKAKNAELTAQLEAEGMLAGNTAEETETNIEPVTDVQETEEAPVEEASSSGVQYVQSQEGNTQQDSYFVLETNTATYTQIGDAFVTQSTYDDKQILVIPIKYKNLSDDTQDPWMSFASDYKAYQEDDIQEYTLTGGSSGLEEQYQSDPMLNLKPGAEIDYYIAYELELPSSDVTLGEYIGNDIHQTFKFQ